MILDIFNLTKLIRFFLLTSCIYLLSACGGGGGSGEKTNGVKSSSSSNLSSSISSTNGQLIITKENANSVTQHTIDSGTTIIKLAVQLQEVLDALILSDQDYIEFNCSGSGNAVINIDSNDQIIVDFNNCDNAFLEESFDGQLSIGAEAIFYNLAHEVHFRGTIKIKDSVQLNGDKYSSISGGFYVTQQATWHGDVLHINHLPADPITLQNANGSIAINSFVADIEYDLDGGLNTWPHSRFYGEFDIGIQSSELGGRFSCDSKDQFSFDGWETKNLEIYCSGSVEKALLIKSSDNYVSDLEISLLNTTTQQYKTEWIADWRDYFRSLALYQPGFPQPKREIPELPSIEFEMSINDAVYSTSKDRFYILISNDAPEYSNHLIEFNANTGEVDRSVALKGEADEIAISSDGTVVYLGYTDFNEVQRVELNTLTLTNILNLGNDFDYSLHAEEIAISPESEDIVAIATYRNVESSRYVGDLKIFRAGVEQTLIKGWNADPTRLAFNEDGSRLITYTDDSTSYAINVFSIESTDPELMVTQSNYSGGPSEIQMLGNTLYNGTGSVMNPETGTLFGRYIIQNGYEYETYRKMNPLITPDLNHTYIYAKYLEVFDRERFTYLGAFDPKLEGNFLRLFNIAENKFAFITDAGIKIFEHARVPANHDWQCEIFDIPDLKVEIDIERINCLFNDAVFSSIHNKIYASVPGAAGISGNSIAVINSESLAIEQYLPVGSNPTELEISHDQQFLYIAYTGANKYSVIKLDSLTTEMDVDLGSRLYFDGPLFVGDLEPFPDDSNSVLISISRSGYTTDYAGMAVYTNGQKAPNELDGVGFNPAANRVRFIDDNHVLGYNNDNTGFELTEYTVDTSGITFISEYEDRIEGFTNELEYSNGRLYSSLGYVVDATTKELLGKMEGLDTDNWTVHQFTVDEEQRVLYLYASMLIDGNDPVLKVYSLDTFEELAAVKMPAFAVLLGQPKALINLDSKLLVVLENFIYSIDKDELNNLH